MKAISQEAKKAIVEALNSIEFDGFEGFEDWVSKAISVVESFPTSDEGRWIPVEERLPNSSEYVIITNGRYVSFADYFDNKWYYPSNESPPFIYTDVTHWQPLPKSPTK